MSSVWTILDYLHHNDLRPNQKPSIPTASWPGQIPALRGCTRTEWQHGITRCQQNLAGTNWIQLHNTSQYSTTVFLVYQHLPVHNAQPGHSPYFHWDAQLVLASPAVGWPHVIGPTMGTAETLPLSDGAEVGSTSFVLSLSYSFCRRIEIK